jgi:hypothetical protein
MKRFNRLLRLRPHDISPGEGPDRAEVPSLFERTLFGEVDIGGCYLIDFE